MKRAIEIIYGLFKIVLAICVLPLVIVLTILLSTFNIKGMFNQILEDLEKLYKFLLGSENKGLF